MTTPLTKLAFYTKLQSLLKSADRRQSKSDEDSRDLLERELPMDSLGAILADYLTPGLWGAERAGRADAIADAAGASSTPLSLSHPRTATALASLVGSGLGMGLGAVMHPPHSEIQFPLPFTAGFDTSITPSMMMGSALGGSAGALLQSAHRRHLMRDALELGRSQDVESDPNVVKYKQRPGRNFFLPLGGFHRYGRNRMMELLADHDARGPRTTGGRVANVATLVGLLPAVFTGAGKGYIADAAQRRTPA